MTFKPKDHFFRKAKEQNFAARSVFKLEEIDQRFKLFHNGQKVLDLGASPGSWSQYASKKVGTSGKVLGIDLTLIELKLPNTQFVQADLRDINLENLMKEKGIEPPFDLVLSDMAPNTTGIRITDQARSFELCEIALEQARRWLKPGGHFVCKLFHSDDFIILKKEILKTFERFEAVKPESTRKISKEIFLVGIKKKSITGGSK
jgi:23S rRNA (uridine2552-2'-O)-methyltransferase